MQKKKKMKKVASKKQKSVYPFQPSQTEVDACFALARFWDKHPEYV